MSVRVEWYGIAGYGGVSLPSLRTTGQHWNPDEGDDLLVTEDDEYGDEDAIDTEVALTFDGDEVGVLVGSATDLRAWLTSAVAQLDAYDVAQAEAKANGMCIVGTEDNPVVRGGPEAHEWTLTEDGYQRTWVTDVTLDADGVVIGVSATYTGSESWSEDGDGHEYLVCVACGARLPIPEDVVVEYD